jgi:hypothetical protein
MFCEGMDWMTDFCKGKEVSAEFGGDKIVYCFLRYEPNLEETRRDKGAEIGCG